MDKTYRDEFSRLFVVDHLPGSFSPADAHLQIYDNYVSGTRLRFRRIRIPGTRDWTRILQQRIPGSGHTKIAEIYLDEDEYRALGAFEGNEIRKNRYFTEIDGAEVAFDIFLGQLAGLKTAKVETETDSGLSAFEFPFAALEVTGESFFDGSNLFRAKFADVEAEVAKLLRGIHSQHTVIGEIASEYE